MIHEDATRSPDGGSAPPAERIDTFEAAIATVAARTRALSSAISEVAFADAARLRDELGLAIADAEVLASGLPEGMKRVAALHKLGAMHGVANDLRQIAPAPSAAAIAAMAAGDPALWSREEEAWIADRLARGSNPRLPMRRERGDTRPCRPWALRAASGPLPEATDAAPDTTHTLSSSPVAAADEEGR